MTVPTMQRPRSNTPAKLFPGERAAVLTVWERFIDTMTRVGGGLSMVVDYDEIDAETEKATQEKAEEGAKLAKEAGLEADAHTAVVDTTVADAILVEAAAVAGERGGLRQPRLHGSQVADAGQRLQPRAPARRSARTRGAVPGGRAGSRRASRKPALDRLRSHGCGRWPQPAQAPVMAARTARANSAMSASVVSQEHIQRTSPVASSHS